MLYNIPGRSHSFSISPRNPLCLSLTMFLVEEKSSEGLLPSTAWSGSAVHVLIMMFGERPSGTGMNGLLKSYCHSSLAQKIGLRHPHLLQHYSHSHPPRNKVSRRLMVRVVPSRSPITIS